MAGLLLGEKEKPFVKGSSKPKEDETLESRIKKEIYAKQKYCINEKSIYREKISDVVISQAKKCDNPNSNYRYKGTATVRIYKSDEDKNQEYQEFRLCNISGYAQVDENNVVLIGDISIDSGLPKHIKVTL